jgi:hypothetical protein
MDRRKAKTLSGLIIAALLLFPSIALTKNPKEIDSCIHFANLARTTAEDRDAGVPSDKVRSSLAGTLAAERKHLVEELITLIYSDDSIAPDQAAAAALRGCLGHP